MDTLAAKKRSQEKLRDDVLRRSSSAASTGKSGLNVNLDRETKLLILVAIFFIM